MGSGTSPDWPGPTCRSVSMESSPDLGFGPVRWRVITWATSWAFVTDRQAGLVVGTEQGRAGPIRAVRFL
ncbi:hypothetical protein NL676_015977 [Syzygium grande]|nr:hypothetical protein NL676_015977 [Syzygium grande]